MLSIDPIDDPGSFLPGEPPPVPAEGVPAGEDRHAGHAVSPARPLTDIVPHQAMANGGTIIRPGAVAWGGTRADGIGGGHQPRRRYSSCEAIERALAGVVANPGELPGLLTELATTRLWVPLPDRQRPFTDGAAVRLPLVGYQDDEFVPCFTSVQRLTAWADLADAATRRAGDARTVPHLVVPAAGLAERLPAGIGLALNPDSVPGLPLYPECVPFLASIAEPWFGSATVPGGLIGHPPGEPATLLAETRAALGALPAARLAAAAWLAVPGEGAGLVIAVTLDDPAAGLARVAAVEAIERAAGAVPLRVPFPLDVTFPGEPPGPDAIGDWIAGNTSPFYVRA
jgi:SseB protein N-terminal domain